MTTVPDQLCVALADRYTIERELGRGGMATACLAHDLRHDRDVAIKVLRDDLTATLGKERFLSEISIAAGLTHPHILPMLDSGDVAGMLFYVMPYFEAESLRTSSVIPRVCEAALYTAPSATTASHDRGSSARQSQSPS